MTCIMCKDPWTGLPMSPWLRGWCPFAGASSFRRPRKRLDRGRISTRGHHHRCRMSHYRSWLLACRLDFVGLLVLARQAWKLIAMGERRKSFHQIRGLLTVVFPIWRALVDPSAACWTWSIPKGIPLRVSVLTRLNRSTDHKPCLVRYSMETKPRR